MARTRHKSTKRSRALALRPFTMSAPKPIVLKQTRTIVKHSKRKGSRHHAKGGLRGLTDPARIGIVVGGAAVGFLQKQNLNLPTLPVLGQAGTIGLAAYLLSDGGKHKLADEICTAALTVAAYQLGSTGSVVGQEEIPGGGGFVTGY